MVKSLKKVAGKEEPTIINTGKFFYDGSNNLNVVKVDCNILSLSPNDCVNNNDCGIFFFILYKAGAGTKILVFREITEDHLVPV